MGRNNWLGNKILYFYTVTFKPRAPGKPKAVLSSVPAGLKYLLKAYRANSLDARHLGKVSKGQRPLQLPPSLLPSTWLSGEMFRG
jgi:hypothetical protein